MVYPYIRGLHMDILDFKNTYFGVRGGLKTLEGNWQWHLKRYKRLKCRLILPYCVNINPCFKDIWYGRDSVVI